MLLFSVSDLQCKVLLVILALPCGDGQAAVHEGATQHRLNSKDPLWKSPKEQESKKSIFTKTNQQISQSVVKPPCPIMVGRV